MKIKIKVEKEVDIKYCQVKAQVRYWDDATVDGVEDTEGTLIPCREGELWCPLINIETGVITNWEQGKTADVHFKVCDAGSYYLQDEYGVEVLSIEDDYVPNSLIPGNYGDYIVMTVDGEGKIKEWKTPADLSDFINDEDD
jgi:hypothetical protein